MMAIVVRGLLSFSLILMLVPAAAQSPFATAQAVKIIIPLTPGTGPDIIARVVGPKLSEKWKVPVIVENRPGASGVIGTDLVAKAPSDGRTLLLTANSFVTNASLRRDLPYDPVRDFSPVMLVGRAFYTLAANPGSPADTVGELVSLAKASPGKVNYGSSGPGTPSHLAMELFKAATGTDIVHVPYKAMSGLTTDLVSGVINVAFIPTPVALSLVAGKKLKLFAAGSTQRTAFTPGVRSFLESGVCNFDVDIWIGLLSPVSTPLEIITTLNGDIGGVLNLPEVRAVFMKQGIAPIGGTPAELAGLIKSDMQRWGKVKWDADVLQN